MTGWWISVRILHGLTFSIFGSARPPVLPEFARAWDRDEARLRITLLKQQSCAEGLGFRTHFAICLAVYIHDGTAAFHLRKIFKSMYSFICKRPGCWIHETILIETIPKPWTMSKGASQVRRAQFLWRHALHWTFFNSQRQIFHLWPDQVEPVGKLTTTKNLKKKKKKA